MTEEKRVAKMVDEVVKLPPQAIQFNASVESARAVMAWIQQFVPAVTGTLNLTTTGDTFELFVDGTTIASLIVGDYLVWDGGVIALMHEMEYNNLYAPERVAQPDVVADTSEWTDPVPTETD